MTPAPRGLLVGRVTELAILAGCVEDAVGGLARLAIVRGEAGIGKTRLVEEVAARAAAHGAVVAWGRCWEEGGAPAGWPIRELLRELGDNAALAEVGADLARARAALDDVRADGDRFVACEAVAEALVRASRIAPIVAVLDDLHWADAGSLVVLKFVARRTARARLLVIGTLRDDDAAPGREPARLLADLGREATGVALRGLGADDVAILAARAGAPIEAAPRIHQATAGNPLYVEEVARELSAGGTAAGSLPLPDSVRTLIARRLDRLPAATRTLVARAAAIGPEIELALLREATVLAGQPWSDAALDVAVAQRILLPSPRGLRFAHDLIRLAARAGAPDAAADHRAIAAALEAIGGDPADRAHHLFAAADPRAIAIAVEAAAHASARLAFSEATALLARACDAARAAQASDVEVAKLQLALGVAQLQAGDVPRGEATCRAVAALALRRGDATLLARAALAYGVQVKFAVVDPEQVRLLEAALVLVRDDVPMRVQLQARLAAAMQPSDTPEEPLALARRAIADARGLGDRALLAGVLDRARPAFRPIDDVDERIEIDDATVRIAIELGDDALRLRAGLRLSADLLQRCDVAGSDHQLAQVEGLAIARRQPSVLFQVSVARAARHQLTGTFDGADAEMRHAARHLALVPDPDPSVISNQLPALRVMLLHARARSADRAEVDALWASALPGPPPLRDLTTAALCARFGSLTEARAALARFATRGEQVRRTYFACAMLPQVIADLGDVALATEMLPLVTALGETCVIHAGMALCEGAAPRLLGLLLGALGRHDEAIVALERGLAANQAMGAAPMVHQTQLALGEVRLRRAAEGDRAAGRAALVCALAGFDALGMTVLSERARARLGATAAIAASAPRAATPTLPPALATLRLEGEVWALEYAGATVRFTDAHGLRYLAYLLARPGDEVHVSDLTAVIRGEATEVGDAGPMLDPEAKAAYRHRLAELREMVEEATILGDAGRLERGRREIDFLAAELAGAVGLDGRDRRAASQTERQRVTVTMRIRKAIKRIAAHCPPVADHLDRAVATGTYCSYDPPPGPRVTT